MKFKLRYLKVFYMKLRYLNYFFYLVVNIVKLTKKSDFVDHSVYILSGVNRQTFKGENDYLGCATVNSKVQNMYVFSRILSFTLFR